MLLTLLQNQDSVVPPPPDRGILFIDVETGHVYWRLNATTPLILRVT